MMDQDMHIELQFLHVEARDGLSENQYKQANEYAAKVWNDEMLTRNQIIIIATHLLLKY